MTAADRLLNVRTLNRWQRATDWALMATAVVIAVPLALGTVALLAAVYLGMLTYVLAQRPQFWLGVVVCAILAKLVGVL